MDPKDWDPKRERTNAKPGTYLDGINDALDRYDDAATAVEHEGIHLQQGQITLNQVAILIPQKVSSRLSSMLMLHALAYIKA